MSRKLYEFYQSDYWPGSEGVCFSACALWCRTMLESQKDEHLAPTVAPENRRAVLALPQNLQRVASSHTAYTSRNVQARSNATALHRAGDVSKILNHNGFGHEAQKILDAVVPVADDVIGQANQNIPLTLQSLGLRIASTSSGVTWGGLPGCLTTGHAYVLAFTIRQGSGHALGLYRTGGRWFNDFYVFEPNRGEYLANVESDLSELIILMMATPEYNNPTEGRLLHVELA